MIKGDLVLENMGPGFLVDFFLSCERPDPIVRGRVSFPQSPPQNDTFVTQQTAMALVAWEGNIVRP